MPPLLAVSRSYICLFQSLPRHKRGRSRLMTRFYFLGGSIWFSFSVVGRPLILSCRGNRLASLALQMPKPLQAALFNDVDSLRLIGFLACMSIFLTCWDHLILRIFLWHGMSNASCLFSSLSYKNKIAILEFLGTCWIFLIKSFRYFAPNCFFACFWETDQNL